MFICTSFFVLHSGVISFNVLYRSNGLGIVMGSCLPGYHPCYEADCKKRFKNLVLANFDIELCIK